MASKESKIIRRAEAQNELQRLSALLAEHLNVEMPDVALVPSRDPELAQIVQLETINGLLGKVLESSGVDTKVPDPADEMAHMKKAELIELAESKGIEVNKSQTKAEIIEALNDGPSQ